MHPSIPPNVLVYCLIIAACVAGMFMVARFIREPLATPITWLLALVPVVLSIVWRQYFFHRLDTAGFVGLTPLETIEHRHQISLWAGVISSGVLLVVAMSKAAFISHRRHSH